MTTTQQRIFSLFEYSKTPSSSSVLKEFLEVSLNQSLTETAFLELMINSRYFTFFFPDEKSDFILIYAKPTEYAIQLLKCHDKLMRPNH